MNACATGQELSLARITKPTHPKDTPNIENAVACLRVGIMSTFSVQIKYLDASPCNNLSTGLSILSSLQRHTHGLPCSIGNDDNHHAGVSQRVRRDVIESLQEDENKGEAICNCSYRNVVNRPCTVVSAPFSTGMNRREKMNLMNPFNSLITFLSTVFAMYRL